MSIATLQDIGSLIRQVQSAFIVVLDQERGDVNWCFQFDDPVCAAHGLPGFRIDMRDITQLFTEIEGRAVLIQKAGQSATAHERDGFKAFDGAAHGIKTVRVQHESIDRRNTWNIKNELYGQVALPVLKFLEV